MVHTAWHQGDLAGLRADWERLFEIDVEATPFTSFAWAAAWMAHWAPELSPRILTVREGGALVGLAAFVMHRRGPFRVLGELGEPPVDYWDVLAEPARRNEVLAAVAKGVAESRDWDAILLTRLPQRSSTARFLEEAGLRVTTRALEPYPGIVLPATFSEYLASLPQARRTNLRRRLRHLDDGDVWLREIRDPAEISAAVDRWQELRVRQWREMGKDLAEAHASPPFKKLLAQVLSVMMPAGATEFWEFHAGDRLVGSYISFVDARCFYQYLGGFDPGAAKLGIGKIAIGHGIRSSIEAGRSYYDFMMGGEDYKYWYGAVDRFCVSLLFSHEGPRSRAARTLSSLRQRQLQSRQVAE